jgi:thymidylate synthase
MERVLFCKKRDANPFFHLMEGLWMLAGRKDSAYLNRYVATFGERFGESDGTIHDAYGHRWRKALGFDQLDVIVEKLRTNPKDRQCVLQMWSGDPDQENDLLGDWKGRPCNTHVYFAVRTVLVPSPAPLRSMDRVSMLDMTITCRSNDAVWGAHGANAVHFSMLQEYMAGRIGVEVGTMYQFSNNYHGYVSELDRIGDPIELSGVDPYSAGMKPRVMATDWSKFDADLVAFMKWHDDGLRDGQSITSPMNGAGALHNDWFVSVAGKVALARWQWTHGCKPSARTTVEAITAMDWRAACLEWMDRREAK